PAHSPRALRMANGAVDLQADPAAAVAARVEAQGMTVDLPPRPVAKHEAGGPFLIEALEFAERIADALHVFQAYAEVEIVVRTRLCAEQRIDTPAALDPEVDAVTTQALHDLDHISGGQLYCACARWSPSASSVSTA